MVEGEISIEKKQVKSGQGNTGQYIRELALSRFSRALFSSRRSGSGAGEESGTLVLWVTPPRAEENGGKEICSF